MKKTLVMLLAICLIVSFTGCGSEEMDYNNPDVTLFVKQLKTGTYKMKYGTGNISHLMKPGRTNNCFFILKL